LVDAGKLKDPLTLPRRTEQLPTRLLSLGPAPEVAKCKEQLSPSTLNPDPLTVTETAVPLVVEEGFTDKLAA
jgi:hypothetical protein